MCGVSGLSGNVLQHVVSVLGRIPVSNLSKKLKGEYVQNNILKPKNVTYRTVQVIIKTIKVANFQTTFTPFTKFSFSFTYILFSYKFTQSALLMEELVMAQAKETVKMLTTFVILMGFAG